MTHPLSECDAKYVWHPYSPAQPTIPALAIERAKGAILHLETGEQLIDGMSSWWCTIHGYNHPVLNNAANSQIDSMSHVMFGGLTHRPAVELCKRLVDITPNSLQKVFLADSGSVSVEVSLKMAMQFFHAKGKPHKHRIMALRRGYHGDTLGAMSVCDPDTGMHSLFANNVVKQLFLDEPPQGFDHSEIEPYIEYLRAQFKQHHNNVAAIILEPIVQGAGGMRFYSPEILNAIRELCDTYDVLLIADEIATGFARTGRMFACEWANIEPDILCVGKALTGGYLTLAATLCTQDVAETISSGEAGCFMHGPTFMGNPLACSVANASLALLTEEHHPESHWQANVERIESALKSHLAPLANLKGVNDVRCFGAIGVVELNNAVDMGQFQQLCTEQRIWLRPFGKLVYTMPHLNCPDHELNLLCSGMSNAITIYLQTMSGNQ